MPFRQENLLNNLKYNDNRYVKKDEVIVGEDSIAFVTNPPIRILWESSTLKIQVYYNGEWHTHLSG